MVNLAVVLRQPATWLPAVPLPARPVHMCASRPGLEISVAVLIISER